MGEILWAGWGYLLVWLVFVAFLVWNEGVVVGDRSAHVAVFHPTQVLYFLAFALAFSSPFCAAKVRPFLDFCRSHYLVVLASSLLAWATVDSYTLSHPYLLADNRHLTFYFWRKIIAANEWSRYALVPLYVFGGYCVMHSLLKANFLFRVSFPLVLVGALTPQLLLEFRYFIVPYLLYRLQLRPTAWWKLGLEAALYVAVNAFTVALFVLKPFKWEHDQSDVQRIIW